ARDTAPLIPKIEDQIKIDLVEMIAAWAEVKTRLATPSDSRRVDEEVLAALDEARSACGPSSTLDRLRHSLADRLGRPVLSPEEQTAPRSAYDHYDLGRSLLREKRYEAAAAEFRLSLVEQPQEFWPNFYLGTCAYHLGRFDEAISAFAIGIALDPRRAECYFNRAIAAERLGRIEAALGDYDLAIKKDPRLPSARLNRGILLYKLGRHTEAIAEFRRALQTTTDRKTRGRIHYNLALVHLRRGDRHSARVSADQASDDG